MTQEKQHQKAMQLPNKPNLYKSSMRKSYNSKSVYILLSQEHRDTLLQVMKKATKSRGIIFRR